MANSWHVLCQESRDLKPWNLGCEQIVNRMWAMPTGRGMDWASGIMVLYHFMGTASVLSFISWGQHLSCCHSVSSADRTTVSLEKSCCYCAGAWCDTCTLIQILVRYLYLCITKKMADTGMSSLFHQYIFLSIKITKVYLQCSKLSLQHFHLLTAFPTHKNVELLDMWSFSYKQKCGVFPTHRNVGPSLHTEIWGLPYTLKYGAFSTHRNVQSSVHKEM